MKKTIHLVLFSVFLFFGLFAFADDGAAPTYLDGIIKALQNISPTAIASVMAVLEIGLRLVPSFKPLSLLVPIKYALSGLVVILSWLADIVEKLIAIANVTKV